MSAVPRDPAVDSTFAMMQEGYQFIWNRSHRFGADIFLARIMGRKTVCIVGPEASELFHDERRMLRDGSFPRRAADSRFGKHAVDRPDEALHRHLEAVFHSSMSPENVGRLLDKSAEHWRLAIHRWEREPSIRLFDEVQRVLTAATCDWAGTPLEDGDVVERARDFARMIDGSHGLGPRLWEAKAARIRTERWVVRLLEDVRKGRLLADPQTALSIMATHRDPTGQRLPSKLAAVELIDVLQPVITNAFDIAFAALALHQSPSVRPKLVRSLDSEASGEKADVNGDYADFFIQEVRRFYPLTPFLGARVRSPFVWRGHAFERGTPVLLDVHGTNHDPRRWEAPDEFRPERFADSDGAPFDSILEGDGPRVAGRRYPTEWITWITLHNVRLALHFLTRGMTYEVAAHQDLTLDLKRMPTMPKSGFVIESIQGTDRLTDAPSPALPSRSFGRNDAAAMAAHRSGANDARPSSHPASRAGTNADDVVTELPIAAGPPVPSAP